MVRMSRKQLFLLSLVVAIINYFYQSLIVEPLRKEKTTLNYTHDK
ncbi:hypothetical protein V7266_22965 [Neobacillus drentensis]